MVHSSEFVGFLRLKVNVLSEVIVVFGPGIECVPGCVADFGLSVDGVGELVHPLDVVDGARGVFASEIGFSHVFIGVDLGLGLAIGCPEGVLGHGEFGGGEHLAY